MDSRLFRQEAIESQGTNWLGNVSAVVPVGAWAFALLFTLATVGFSALLAWGSYSERTAASGSLLPAGSAIAIVAPVSGLVEAIKLSEGNRVTAGQILAIVGGQPVRAPATGELWRRLASLGQPVHAGQPLMSMVGTGSQLQAELRVPATGTDRLKVGDRVSLAFDAFSQQRFGRYGGEVISVSTAVVPIGIDRSGASVVGRRVMVRLDQQFVADGRRRERLHAGDPLQAYVLGDRKRLWEWLLQPRRGSGRAAH